ncbi:hypothetical protein GGR52DRAFT_577779 [Hypoxylon sp. FL1284]|nr:hypothetical protein GGR52DRAFT_577779 [Hypoxylon sp. FL1284]
MTDLDFSHLSPSELDDALNRPALPAPPDVTPNFEHPGNKNTRALAALLLCATVSTISLAVRVYVRFFRIRQRHVFYLFVIVGSLRQISVASGLFIHQWEMLGKDMADYVQALLVFTVLFYAAIIIALNLTCIPHQRIWNKTVPGRCIDIKIINLVAAVVSLVLDLAVLVLPQKIIWSLCLSSGKKLGISAVFAVGVFACIAAACLLEAIVEWILKQDMTYHYSGVTLWAIAESTCGILVFCVPVAPKAFHSLNLSNRLSSIYSWMKIPMPRQWREKGREERAWPHTGLRSLRPRTYQSIQEPSAASLREVRSIRPTDQQYGIVCTTDIMVTESYEQNGVKAQHSKDHLWLPGVEK